MSPISRSTRLGPEALIFGATLGLAFKGILARLAYAEGITVIGLIVLRMAMATPLFWAGWALLRGRFAHEERKGDRGKAIAVGALFLLAGVCDFTAIEKLGAGPSRVVLFTYPLWVMLLSSLMERRMPRRIQLIAFVVAWSGLLLVLSPSGAQMQGAGEWLEGVAWALGAALSYAVYLVVGQPLVRRLGSVRFTVASQSGAAVLLALAFPLIRPSGDLGIGPEAAGWIALMASACTVIPIFMWFEGMRHVGPSRAGLIALMGPVITVVAAVALLGEKMTLTQIGGALLVFVGVVGLRERESAATRAPSAPDARDDQATTAAKAQMASTN